MTISRALVILYDCKVISAMAPVKREPAVMAGLAKPAAPPSRLHLSAKEATFGGVSPKVAEVHVELAVSVSC